MEAESSDDTLIDFVEPLLQPREFVARQRRMLLAARWMMRGMFFLAVAAAVSALFEGEVARRWYRLPLAPIALVLLWQFERLKFCPECDSLDWPRIGKPRRIFCQTCSRFNGKREALLDVSGRFDLGDARDLNQEPVVKLIAMVFLVAIKERATEVRFEPGAEWFRVHCRCDGVLYELVPPPLFLHKGVTGALKAMAGLKPDRSPQIGAIRIKVDVHTAKARVESSPTESGEDVIVSLPDFGA